MTDLDLTRIKDVADSLLDDESIPDNLWTQRAIGVVARVPALVAEVERQQRLLGEPFPSSDSYESMAQALADERAEVVRHCDRIAVLESLLGEILDRFPSAAPSTATYAIRSNAVPPETLDRWRSHLERAS